MDARNDASRRGQHRRGDGATAHADGAPAGNRPGRRPLPGRPVRARHGKTEPGGHIYGALDLGTNNCRLLLATAGNGGFTVVDAFSRIVRLGEGVGRAGMLSEAAMQRTISALRVCANKVKWWRIGKARLIATEACRTAGNGLAFITRVEEELGLKLEIIDRQTEATLAVAGAAPLICPKAETVLVFDIGGGSTELMWLKVHETGYDIISWTSVPAGVVTLAERYGGIHVDEAMFAAMRESVRPLLMEFAGQIAEKLGETRCPAPDHLLGTSGTVTTISGVHLGLRRYDRARVDGCWLTSSDIGRVTGELLAMDYDQRAASPCIGRERADLVLAGCAILEEIRHIWPADRVRVADRGLREGILTHLMMEDGTYGNPS